MPIIWNKQVPRWEGETIEPPESKKDVGYIAGDNPPASWENWLRKGTYEALDETRDVIENIDSQLAQLTNPNLLINGDFKIWQRGTSFTSLNRYTADRFFALGNIEGVATVSKDTRGIKYTFLKAGIASLQYQMELTDAEKLVGKPLTLSFSIDDVIYKHTLTIDSAVSSVYIASQSSGNITFSQSISPTVPNCFQIYMDIERTINKVVVVNWIKLELGTEATLLSPKSYAEELASCQRYYLNKASGRVGQVETNLLRFIVPAPATMRNLPTISSFVINNISGMPQTGFTVTAFGVDGSTLSIDGNKTAHGLTDANIVINGLDAEIY